MFTLIPDGTLPGASRVQVPSYRVFQNRYQPLEERLSKISIRYMHCDPRPRAIKGSRSRLTVAAHRARKRRDISCDFHECTRESRYCRSDHITSPRYKRITPRKLLVIRTLFNWQRLIVVEMLFSILDHFNQGQASVHNRTDSRQRRVAQKSYRRPRKW